MKQLIQWLGGEDFDGVVSFIWQIKDAEKFI
jgi:hypothetical protein